MITQLETWDAQAAEVEFRNTSNTLAYCVFLPGRYKKTEIATPYMGRPEYAVQVLLAEV